MKCLFIAFLLVVIVPVALCELMIVGGGESTPHSRPYQAILFDWPDPSQTFFTCSGTLVNETWMVTAAFCDYSGDVYVGLGYHDRTDHSASGQQYIKGKWHLHPNYDEVTLDNDIALIELETPATLDSNVAVIGISAAGPAEGSELLITGWGAVEENDWNMPAMLHEAKINRFTAKKCHDSYGSGVTDNMFCAGSDGSDGVYRDSCVYDEGGPAVSGFDSGTTLLEGIIAWGYGCGDAQYPGVYTNVAKYCDWINQETGGAVTCQ